MVNRAWAVAAALLACASVPAAAQQQNRRPSAGIGLTVYVDPDFEGESATFREDVSNLQFVGLNDKVSSLRVARGEVWEVCENANFEGRCQVFSGDEPDLRRNKWSDIISSA